MAGSCTHRIFFLGFTKIRSTLRLYSLGKPIKNLTRLFLALLILRLVIVVLRFLGAFLISRSNVILHRLFLFCIFRILLSGPVKKGFEVGKCIIHLTKVRGSFSGRFISLSVLCLVVLLLLIPLFIGVC